LNIDKENKMETLNKILIGVLIGLGIAFAMVNDAKAETMQNVVEQGFFDDLNAEMEAEDDGVFKPLPEMEDEEDTIDKEIAEAERFTAETREDASKYACTPENNCGGLSKEQEDCVVKKRCNAEIRKLLKKLRKLEEENDDLRTQNAVLESERNMEGLIRSHMADREANPKKNSVSLMLGRVATDIELKQEGKDYKAEGKPETDVGLMYQRDFGDSQRYRGSIGLTVRGAGYLGLGLNF
jgi:hypothetical protein